MYNTLHVVYLSTVHVAIQVRGARSPPTTINDRLDLDIYQNFAVLLNVIFRWCIFRPPCYGNCTYGWFRWEKRMVLDIYTGTPIKRLFHSFDLLTQSTI